MLFAYLLSATVVLCGPCNPATRGGVTLCLKNVNLVASVSNIVTDVFVPVIPMPSIWSLYLPVRENVSRWGPGVTGDREQI
ncbi:hypothetical protein BCR34DRAFT_568897 [Clohesyomyces aquaticus]|uniref:Secreted protein n=1 Tax=Clohesyomyces aquaticus TaxID=1231657 RepID=A0A1Y1ZG49_9PLEO|nr:hypothetical protein BCR34DRAFT_568897 [Clohesyomyces aquaticus]